MSIVRMLDRTLCKRAHAHTPIAVETYTHAHVRTCPQTPGRPRPNWTLLLCVLGGRHNLCTLLIIVDVRQLRAHKLCRMRDGVFAHTMYAIYIVVLNVDNTLAFSRSHAQPDAVNCTTQADLKLQPPRCSCSAYACPAQRSSNYGKRSRY